MSFTPSPFPFYSALDENRDSSQLDHDSRVEKHKRRICGRVAWVRICHTRAGLLRGEILLLTLFAVELRYHQYTSAFLFFMIDGGFGNA
jgi:hypothetical protein